MLNRLQTRCQVEISVTESVLSGSYDLTVSVMDGLQLFLCTFTYTWSIESNPSLFNPYFKLVFTIVSNNTNNSIKQY